MKQQLVGAAAAVDELHSALFKRGPIEASGTSRVGSGMVVHSALFKRGPIEAIASVGIGFWMPTHSALFKRGPIEATRPLRA